MNPEFFVAISLPKPPLTEFESALIAAEQALESARAALAQGQPESLEPWFAQLQTTIAQCSLARPAKNVRLAAPTLRRAKRLARELNGLRRVLARSAAVVEGGLQILLPERQTRTYGPQASAYGPRKTSAAQTSLRA